MAVDEDGNPECTKRGAECEGAVGWHESLAGTGGVHSWCEFHWGEICDAYERNRELMSPTPAPWFDPAEAGESWDDDW